MWSPELGEEARWHAREICRRYGVSPPASFSELLTVTRHLGCPVYQRQMAERGLFVPYHRRPFILIRDWGDTWALAHETCHFLMLERFGPDVRGYSEHCITPEEWACRCYAWLLCSRQDLARKVLRGRAPIPVPRPPASAQVPAPAPGNSELGSAAVAYVWTPRDPGAGGSASTARQAALCRAWCRQQDVSLEGVFLDHGDPWGWPLQRRGLDLLLSQAADLLRHGSDLLLLPHPSRLGPLQEMRVGALARLQGIGFRIHDLNAPEWRDPWR